MPNVSQQVCSVTAAAKVSRNAARRRPPGAAAKVNSAPAVNPVQARWAAGAVRPRISSVCSTVPRLPCDPTSAPNA